MPNSSHFVLTLARFRRRLFRNYSLVRRTLVVVVILAVLAGVFLVVKPLLSVGREFFFGPVSVLSVITKRSDEIKNDNGRTNILFLGIGDSGHDGPNLTDSMMLISIKTKLDDSDNVKTPPIYFISVPRDIYLDSLPGKINSAYAIGQDQTPPTGLVMAKSVVSQVTGLPVHYAFRADFSVFRKSIDLLGGIDVTVEKPFDDYEYPIDGKETETCGLSTDELAAREATMTAELAFPCRYEHVHFDAGPMHMDGVTALKFVRSRHAVGDEGTDFARSRRQQLVLTAIRNKVLSSDTLLNPTKLLDIYNQFRADLDTDIPLSDVGAFLKLTAYYRGAEIKSIVLDEKFFDNPPIDSRGWILLPKGGSWDEIHSYVQSQLGGTTTTKP